MTILVTLTTAGTDAGPFDLFSNANGYTSAFATSVTRQQLIDGYPATAPDGTTLVQIISSGACTNAVVVPNVTPSTTSTTSSSTSTTTTSTTVCVTRPVGLEQIKLLGQFQTVLGSPCGNTIYNIIGANHATACALLTTFKNCACGAFPLDANSQLSVEVTGFEVGNKVYLGWGVTNCNVPTPAGTYWIWDNLIGPADEPELYFCGVSDIVIITINSLGEITQSTICSV